MRAGIERKPLTLKDLLSPNLDEYLQNPLRVLKRWGIYKDDPETLRVGKRMDRIWGRLSWEQQWLLIRTAQQVAEAERTKYVWNPKAHRHHYEDLARAVVAAAKLAETLRNWFPATSDTEHAVVDALIAQIVSFIRGALNATMASDKYVAASIARKMLQRLNRSVSKSKIEMPWQLIRSLAWLASGRKFLCEENSERTVRRYLDDVPVPTGGPAALSWRRNWELMRSVCRLMPESNGDAFEKLFENFHTDDTKKLP